MGARFWIIVIHRLKKLFAINATNSMKQNLKNIGKSSNFKTRLDVGKFRVSSLPSRLDERKKSDPSNRKFVALKAFTWRNQRILSNFRKISSEYKNANLSNFLFKFAKLAVF